MKLFNFFRRSATEPRPAPREQSWAFNGPDATRYRWRLRSRGSHACGDRERLPGIVERAGAELASHLDVLTGRSRPMTLATTLTVDRVTSF